MLKKITTFVSIFKKNLQLVDVELLFKKQFLKKAQEAFPKKSRAQKKYS